jgi:hypothetical protein
MIDSGAAFSKTLSIASSAFDKVSEVTRLASKVGMLADYGLPGNSPGSISALSNSSNNHRTASNIPGETENVLNRYRSVTYNFTFAALTPDNLKNPESYRNSKLKYVVAASYGKGENAISSQVVGIAKSKLVTEEVDGVASVNTTDYIDKDTGSSVVTGFNKESPGRFDLFIDAAEIETLLAPNKQSGPAIATKVKFEIFEPMSANGFIEALHVAAIAAGWTGYLNACYVLKIDFLGYPDDNLDPIAAAEKINATRYIPIKLTGSEMEVTETGTRYRCSGVPYNEFGFANPNVIYSDISFSGNKVRSVLENLFEGINKSTKDRAAKEKSREAVNIVDQYKIFFPALPKAGDAMEVTENSPDNKMSKADINEMLRSNAIYKFPPIEESPDAKNAGGAPTQTTDPRNPDTTKRNDPTTNQIQFAKDSNIHEIIEAVIRDSAYWEQILSDIETAKRGDGMVDYFQIMISTIPGEMDYTTNQQRFIYQYIVCPYKVHYSKIPGQQFSNFDSNTLKNYVKRIYNYLYTGQNIDVLSFKLNFNNLFFQAANPKMGNNDSTDTNKGAGAANDKKITVQTDAGRVAKQDQLDRAPSLPDSQASSNSDRGTAIQQNPYYQLAYAAHDAILESVNMMTGELEILGDPYYLSTGGMGNHLPKVKDIAITLTGEANFNNGPVVVRINFRNPVDINKETGLVEFSKTAVAFSGVYQVLSCQSTFRDGMFKQRLKLMRYSGQIADGSDLKATKAKQYVQEDKAGDQQTPDAAKSDVPRAGIKPNATDLVGLIQRGLPTAGLPGAAANLLGDINAAQAQFKKVSGILGPGMNILNQVSGIGNLNIGDSLTGINPLTKGISAGAAALDSLSKNIPGSASLLDQVGNTAKTLLPGNPSALLNDNIGKSLSDSIGGVTSAIGNVGTSVAFGANALLTSAKGILDNPLAAAKNLGSSAADALSGIGDKVKNITSFSPNGSSLTPAMRAAVIADAELKGIPVDQALRNASIFGTNLPGMSASPAAIASKLGIDPSQLSGLTGKLDSKVLTQIEELSKEIPENVVLDDIKKQGIVMANLAGDSLKNLPAVPPKLTAPLPMLPARSLASALTSEQRAAVIADATEKGIPVDQALRNAAVFGINVKGLTPEAQAIALSDLPQGSAGNLSALAALGISGADIASGKLAAMQKQLGGVIPNIGIPSDAFAKVQGVAAQGLNAAGNIGKSANSLISGAGSVEGAQASIQQAMGNPGSAVTQLGNLGKSVTSQFGSLTGAIGTPLDKLMTNSVNKLNDPNAPPYTGTDPIVRRRLGLPPLED